MAGERIARILELLASHHAEQTSARLCDVAVRATALTGAGFMLMSGDIPRGSLCSSDHVSALIEDLQFTLGEGPCVDAYNQDRPVLEPDLADPVTPRWLAFTPRAVESGVRAVFGFPVKVGVVKLGSLNLYRDHTGPLTYDQHADALVMADVAAKAVIAMQSEASPGAVAVDLETGADFRLAVHQASGMVSAQLDVSVGEALIRLRAYAFRKNQLLDDVANDIVHRRLRFENDGSDEYGT